MLKAIRSLFYTTSTEPTSVKSTQKNEKTQEIAKKRFSEGRTSLDVTRNPHREYVSLPSSISSNSSTETTKSTSLNSSSGETSKTAGSTGVPSLSNSQNFDHIDALFREKFPDVPWTEEDFIDPTEGMTDRELDALIESNMESSINTSGIVPAEPFNPDEFETADLDTFEKESDIFDFLGEDLSNEVFDATKHKTTALSEVENSDDWIEAVIRS